MNDGQGTLFDSAPATSDREYQAAAPTGRYAGSYATDSEWESGEIVEAENRGPLRPDGIGHRVLRVFGQGERLTAYAASKLATDDFHGARREATRLVERGFLVKDGHLANPAPRGRGTVDAYRITDHGRRELERLG